MNDRDERCPHCGSEEWDRITNRVSPGEAFNRCNRCEREWEPSDQQPDGLPYGIIDPDYARTYTIARLLAWQEGYALAMHGSFTRDLDLIAIPWTEKPCDPKKLIALIVDATGLREQHGNPGAKPHGRLVWTLIFPGFSDPRFVDLSIMPRAAAMAAADGAEEHDPGTTQPASDSSADAA